MLVYVEVDHLSKNQNQNQNQTRTRWHDECLILILTYNVIIVQKVEEMAEEHSLENVLSSVIEEFEAKISRRDCKHFHF